MQKYEDINDEIIIGDDDSLDSAINPSEWIIVQNMELGALISSRYSSWSERYFLLKYKKEDKERAARDLTALVNFY